MQRPLEVQKLNRGCGGKLSHWALEMASRITFIIDSLFLLAKVYKLQAGRGLFQWVLETMINALKMILLHGMLTETSLNITGVPFCFLNMYVLIIM